MCALEFAVFTSRNRVSVIEGFVLKPGDRLLLIAPPTVGLGDVRDVIDEVRRNHPEVHVTAVAGFTGVQVDNGEYRADRV